MKSSNKLKVLDAMKILNIPTNQDHYRIVLDKLISNKSSNLVLVANSNKKFVKIIINLI
jgi:hypothetical protein